jgi:hypothetical protein
LYLFNNNANDQRSANTLTAGGTPVFVTSPTPMEGSHAVGPLDNTNYYEGPAALISTSAGRVEFYMQPSTDVAYGSFFTISDRSWTSFNRYMIFRADGTDNKWRLQYTKPTDTSLASTGTWTINTWYHVAICWSAGSVKVYIDNVETLSSADTIDFGTVVGCRWGWHVTAGSNASGYVDEAAFYSATSTGPFPTDHEFSSGSAAPIWFMRRRRGR